MRANPVDNLEADFHHLAVKERVLAPNLRFGDFYWAAPN